MYNLSYNVRNLNIFKFKQRIRSVLAADKRNDGPFCICLSYVDDYVSYKNVVQDVYYIVTVKYLELP